VVDELDRPDFPADMEPVLFNEVVNALDLNFEISEHSALSACGITGFFQMIERAGRLLARRAVDTCIVVAVDSFLNSSALHWLRDQGRLKTELNSDGMIPGEAAAAVCLMRGEDAQNPMLEVMGLGFGVEESAGNEGKPNVAIGLADAIRAALSNADVVLPDVAFRVGGMTGERRAFMEASTALARVQRVHRDGFELWVPAEMLGDVGAALSACMLVVTAVAFAKGYAPGDIALLHVSSRSHHRAACVVSNSKARR
jgi:3-oxoacyl-[acyl-carrier-protein] synthase-1